MSPAGFTQMIISPQQDALEDLCPGEEANIICETRGSSIIAWTSEEYIERGGTQLEFATFNRVGETRVSPVNPNTVATLIEKSVDSNGNMQVLQSQLRIIASVDSTVTCINVDNGMSTSIRIQILGIHQFFIGVSLAGQPFTSLMPSPLHARARKGLVKRVALPCPRGMYIAAQSGCRTVVI